MSGETILIHDMIYNKITLSFPEKEEIQFLKKGIKMDKKKLNEFQNAEILIVEDNVHDLKFLSEVLKEANFKVRQAIDGELALRSIKVKNPSIILLDLNLPGISGLDVCRKLKEDTLTRDIPIIFFSADKKPKLIAKALEIGGVDYITKPFQPIETLARIKNHLNLFKVQEKLKAEIKVRKQTEILLRETELKSSIWLENSPVCTKIVDLDFNLQFMSSSGVKELKIDDITEFYGKPYPLHFYPDSFKIPMTNNLKKAKKTGEIIIQEASIVDVDGKELWYHSTIVPVNDDKGQLDYFMVVSLETTKRANLEKNLKSERDKFNFILNELPIGVSVTDADHKFIYINPISNKIDGYPKNPQSILGKSVINVHPRKNQPQVEKLLKAFVSGEKSLFSRESKRGKRTVDVSYHAIKDSQEMYMGLMRLVSDITEQKKIEGKLRKSAERFERWKASNFIGILHSNSKGEVIDANDTILNMLGYSKQDLSSGKLDWTTLTPPEFLHLDQKAMEEAVKTGTWTPFEKEYFHKDGHRIPILIGGSIFMESPDEYIVFIIDLTEQKHAEEELNKKTKEAQLLSIMLDNSSQPFAIGTPDGKLTRINSAFCKLTGYTEEELLNDISWNETLTPQKWREYERKFLQKVITKGKPQFFEKEYIRKDGKRISVELLMHRTLDAQNTIQNVYGFINDITKRKQVEEALKESEGFLNRTGEIAKVGGWQLNASFDKVLWTRTTGRIHELPDGFVPSLEEAINYYHPDDQELVSECIRLAIEKGEPFEFDTRLITAKGNQRWVRAIGRPTMKDGKCIWLSGTFQDITEQKKTEEKLKEQAVFVQQNPAPVFRVNTDGIIIAINNAAKEVSKDLTIEKSVYKVLRNLSKSVFKNLTVDEQIQIEESIGSKTYLFTIRKDTTTQSIYFFGSNISERKQTEIELIKTKEKAEESERLKSTFLANMSHEIRTPMNGILGFTGLLKERDIPDVEKEKYIRVIENSGNRLLNIINDLIDMSKIEAGLVEVLISETDINNLSDQLLIFFKRQAETKGLQLSLSTTLPDKEAILLSDQEKLYSILTNLINNAIKYTQNGSIDFGYIIKGDTEPVEVEFFVKDTGNGIHKERLEAIFDRFIRSGLNDDIAEGSGLGLSISKAYVEMLGGKIWVESEGGVGSQFYFTIPYKPVKSKVSEFKDAESETKLMDQINPKASGLKILIAEDDETAVNLLSILVKNISKEIIYAKTGIEAVELFRKNPDIDVVLMDIQMSGMNGYEATKQIREFNKDVVIIAQTAYAIAGDREKSIEAGCNDYISKPLNKKELLEKIENCLSR